MPEELKDAVKAAVVQTLAALSASVPREALNGYALVTDDDLRTLGHLACTNEFAESQDPSVRFEPVDWVYNDGAEAFDRARDLLATSADAASGSLASHVTKSFSSLVAALHELKKDGLFGDNVFLTVISTDPSEQLERLEEGAVRTLNSEGLYRQWKASTA